MPYRIGKTFEFESGHLLSKHSGACRFPHGHSRKVEFVLEADVLDKNDMVCDFQVLKEATAVILQQFDHAFCLNTNDPKYSEMKAAYGEKIVSFENADPTTEILAKNIFDSAKIKLQQTAPNARLIKVRVWETSSAWAEFAGT